MSKNDDEIKALFNEYGELFESIDNLIDQEIHTSQYPHLCPYLININFCMYKKILYIWKKIFKQLEN